MWRWIIRVWVGILLFYFLMFSSSAILIQVARLFVWAGLPQLSRLVHTHNLFTMFLLGVVAGQVVLGSNFTGRGWFRSKSGLTYEGFKLESIKPWTWLFISPWFLLGVISWGMKRSESAISPIIAPISFYNDLLIPNCPLVSWKYPQLYPFCGEQLIFVGIWMASIGYSFAPRFRKHGSKLWHRCTVRR